MPGLPTTTVSKNLKDATYVLIGLGVVGYQRAQARSEELAKQFDAQVSDARTQITKLAKDAQARFEPVRGTVEGRLDALQARLPEQAKTIVAQARTAAQEAEASLRSRLTNAA